MKHLNALRRQAGVRSLLSGLNTNPKVAKNGKLGVQTAVMHLAPGDMSGHEVCPKRSPGCSAACLHFAGSPAFLTGKTKSRIARTKLFFADRNLFMNILVLEIAEHIAKAANDNMEPAVRLNATSDIVWERKKFTLMEETKKELNKINVKMDLSAYSVITMFPTTSFYDYTAISGRITEGNYHLTFSLKEQNMNEAFAALRGGMNVAAVFPYKQIPAMFMGVPVIDGDAHDYRPADPKHVIVGLKAKGTRGRADNSGFVYRVSEPANDDTYEETPYQQRSAVGG
jgi:hypothetical protein